MPNLSYKFGINAYVYRHVGNLKMHCWSYFPVHTSAFSGFPITFFPPAQCLYNSRKYS